MAASKASMTATLAAFVAVCLLVIAYLTLEGCTQSTPPNTDPSAAASTADNTTKSDTKQNTPSSSTNSEGDKVPLASKEMQNYTVALPDSFAQEFEFVIQQTSHTPDAEWIDDTVSICSKDTGYALFTVACYSNDWSPQGFFYAKNLGTTSQFKNASIYLLQPRTDTEGNELPDETATYASYVTLR